MAPRHGGRPLQQRRRREEERKGMEAAPGSAARELHCGAVRREIPSPPRPEWVGNPSARTAAGPPRRVALSGGTAGGAEDWLAGWHWRWRSGGEQGPWPTWSSHES